MQVLWMEALPSSKAPAWVSILTNFSKTLDFVCALAHAKSKVLEKLAKV